MRQDFNEFVSSVSKILSVVIYNSCYFSLSLLIFVLTTYRSAKSKAIFAQQYRRFFKIFSVYLSQQLSFTHIFRWTSKNNQRLKCYVCEKGTYGWKFLETHFQNCVSKETVRDSLSLILIQSWRATVETVLSRCTHLPKRALAITVG